MIQILLVEDDENISFGIKAALKRKEYACTSCTTIEEAKRVFTDSFQLVLLDLNLPDGTGYEFCSWVKERSQMPIIFLTVRDDVKDITRGLDMGADDYITKPFHIAVLESRIAAVLRRIGSEQNTEEKKGLLSCGDIQLDTEKMQAYLDGSPVDLTALEYRLLYVMMENKGRTLPRNLILEKLWDAEGNFVNDNTLTVTVKRLRKKLLDTKYIVTIRGIGYRMEECV
ncbi:response regulator transcription factor [Faecalicatena sp. AGMB00832]|uniref:Response regulator transcription factor n=1 Tax=Faecalicatena faecalis TaxID=2726362 RepID=A0ABS6D3L0_9FIRM|nr:response regulator transcription factor [Faecalicatena faecalis]MBU3876178.1 response regulator transcription factor [Faecalicatena faecalis]